MVGKISFSIFRVKILLKTIKRLYRINSVAYYTDCIFWELISYYEAFSCIIKMKLALSRLYIVNRVFLTNKV